MNLDQQFQKADNYRNNGQTKKAIAIYQKLAKIYDQEKNYYEASHALQQIGVSHKIDNDEINALKTLKKAYLYAQKHQEHLIAGATLRDIGITYAYKKKFKLALKYLRQSEKQLEKLGESEHLAITIAKIGGIYTKTKKFNQAQIEINKALKMFQTNPHWFFEATTLMHLVDLQIETKKYEDALGTLEKVETIFNKHKKEEPHLRRFAQIYGGQAYVLAKLGEKEKAKRLWQKTQTIIKENLSHDAADKVYEDIRAEEIKKLLL